MYDIFRIAFLDKLQFYCSSQTLIVVPVVFSWTLWLPWLFFVKALSLFLCLSCLALSSLLSLTIYLFPCWPVVASFVTPAIYTSSFSWSVTLLTPSKPLHWWLFSVLLISSVHSVLCHWRNSMQSSCVLSPQYVLIIVFHSSFHHKLF